MSGTDSPFFDNDDSKSHLDYLTAKDIQNKIVAGIFKLKDKDGRSKVWALFGYVEDAEGNRVPNVVACKVCYKIFRAARGITSNLSKHKCFVEATEDSQDNNKQVSNVLLPQHKEKITQLLLEWIIGSCRPIEILNDQGFSKFIQTILQSAATMGKNIGLDNVLTDPFEIKKEISYLYANNLEELKTNLNTVNNDTYCLSVTLWEDDNIVYDVIAVIVHYIKEGRLKSYFLGFKKIQKDSRADLILINREIELLLKMYNFTVDKKVLFLTNSSMIVASFKDNFHNTCMNYFFNTTIENCLHQVTVIYDLFNTCLDLMKAVTQLDPDFDPPFQIDLYSLKRWTSVYNVFNYIDLNWLKINEIKKIDEINLETIISINKILKIFDDACKKLKETTTPTLHMVVVYVHNLRKICKEDKNDNEILKSLRKTLKHFVNTLLLPNCSVIHKMALYLFPPAKKLLTLEKNEQKFVKSECVRLIKSVILEITQNSNHNLPQIKTKGRKSKNKNEIWTSSVIEETNQDTTIDEKIMNEMELYEGKDSPFHKEFDILQWWYTHKSEFPYLYELSRWIHSVPATSIAAENLFIKARTLIFSASYDLATDLQSINKIIFLNYNMNSESD